MGLGFISQIFVGGLVIDEKVLAVGREAGGVLEKINFTYGTPHMVSVLCWVTIEAEIKMLFPL